jgi:hypothetical protein
VVHSLNIPSSPDPARRDRRWASRLGASYSIYPLWATFYFVGKAGDNPRARDTGRIGIQALIDADIAAQVLKLVTQRPRPEIQGESVSFFKAVMRSRPATLSRTIQKSNCVSRIAAIHVVQSKAVRRGPRPSNTGGSETIPEICRCRDQAAMIFRRSTNRQAALQK